MTFNLDKYLTFNKSKLYTLRKSTLVVWLYTIGILIAFLTTMNPWPLWRLSTTYMVFSSAFIALAMIIDRQLSNRAFSDGNYIYPTVAFFVLVFYQTMIGNGNVSSFIAAFCNCFIFFSFFRYKAEVRQRVVAICCEGWAACRCVCLGWGG